MQLPDEERQELARLSLLIGHHQMILGTLEKQVQALLAPHGVDLARETWNLDSATGRLTRSE